MAFFVAHPVVVGFGLTCFLFGAMVGLQIYGRRVGMRRAAEDPEKHQSGLGAVEGAVFGLFGLLLAFTFAGATGRFEHRKQLILDEANAISAASDRLDLLSPAVRTECRARLRAYLDQHVKVFGEVPDPAAFEADYAELERIGHEVWAIVTKACQGEAAGYSTVLLTPLGEVFDIATTRKATLDAHPPFVIYVLLFVLALVCAFLAGFATAPARRQAWSHVLILAVAIAGTIYVILDLEFPRLGLIRVDSADALLRGLRESLK